MYTFNLVTAVIDYVYLHDDKNTAIPKMYLNMKFYFFNIIIIFTKMAHKF